MKEQDPMRGALRRLAARERATVLDDSQRQRAEQRARRLLAQRQARGPVVRTALAAACLLLVGTLSWQSWPSSSAPSTSARDTPRVAVTSASGSEADPLARAAREGGGERLEFETGAAGQQRLDLGERALVVAAQGTRVHAALSAEQDLRVVLEEGYVAVHARQLRGRSLVVVTPLGEVTVRGTIFQVSFRADLAELHVGVDEGRVEVRTRAAELDLLLPGQGLRAAERATREPFAAAERQRLRHSLGLSEREVAAQVRESAAGAPETVPPAVTLEPSGDGTVSERYWQAGSVDAPREPPEPGSSVTEEGRPMSKPRITRP
jgi:hypothetical protein